MGRNILALTATIAAGIMLAGCGDGRDTAASSTTATTSVSPAEAIAKWGSDHFSSSLDDIGKDFTWIGGAMQGLDFTDARAACRDLDTNVNKLEAKLPTPDRVLTGHVSVVVENLREFSQRCQGLNPQTTEAQLQEMSSYRKQAETAMNEAVQMVKRAQQAS
ncbi:hypothetical protein A5663_03845 [Mycobacterium sp. E740]|nr:hypothetical protein A5663_03845 [Mycobacterium sp. E740]